MVAIQNLEIKGNEYIEAMNQVLDSGEIPEVQIPNFTSLFETTKAALKDTNNLLQLAKNIKKAEPVKKNHILTGEFSLKGRYNIEPGQPIEIEMFGNKWVISDTKNIQDEITRILVGIYGIEEDDVIYIDSSLNYQTDELNFNFAVQTNDELTPIEKGKDIALLTPQRKLTTGYSYRNKVEFSNTNIKELPAQLWNYPCHGFKIPYSVTNDPVDLLNQIRIATSGSHGGTMADLRFWSETYRGIVDPFVRELKNQRWKTILTQWERFYLNPDGATYRSVKMK